MNSTLPTPKLGAVTAITIASPDLEISLNYYQQLGFKEIFRADFPFPWIQITDGALLIMLRKDKNPYIALTYYADEFENVVKELKTAGVQVNEMPTPDPIIKRYLIQSPDRHNITLVTVEGFYQPPGPTMLTMPQQDYMNPDKYVNKICGMFGEFAHPVSDLGASILFWEKLGFKTMSKFTSPYPWAILSDGIAVVGLHQTKHFSHPTITYFAKDSKEKIENLKSKKLKDFPEKAATSNIKLTTPEKQHINLFGLGMGIG